MDKLDQIKRLNKTVRARVKGSKSGATELVGVVLDSVQVRELDNLYVLEKLEGVGGQIKIRFIYFTHEATLRPGCSELRRDYGQYAPILSLSVFRELMRLARERGWKEMSF
jgi:hypothetical protein